MYPLLLIQANFIFIYEEPEGINGLQGSREFIC